jgi:hypothetical protein
MAELLNLNLVAGFCPNDQLTFPVFGYFIPDARILRAGFGNGKLAYRNSAQKEYFLYMDKFQIVYDHRQDFHSRWYFRQVGSRIPS